MQAFGSSNHRLLKGIGHFPMGENYPVFKEYLEQTLGKINERVGAAAR